MKVADESTEMNKIDEGSLAVFNDVKKSINDDEYSKNDHVKDDNVVFARNFVGNTLADCPAITWKTLLVWYWTTKIPIPLQRMILEWTLLSVIIFGLYHLSKFDDSISPLFIAFWLIVVLAQYAAIAMYERFRRKVSISPVTLDNVDKKSSIEVIEDGDFDWHCQSHSNEQMGTWQKMNSVDSNLVHKLIHDRDKVVFQEASNTVHTSIQMGIEASMDRILYPRYDRLGNVANPDHFHSFSDIAIFIRYFLYESADNAVSICEHPLRKRTLEFERIQREAASAHMDSSDSSSSEEDSAPNSKPSPRGNHRDEISEDEADISDDDNEDEEDYHDMYSNSMDEDERSESESEGMSESDFYSDSMDGSYSSGSYSEDDSESYESQREEDGKYDVGNLYEIGEVEEE